jgi:hypothetical protein
VIALAAAAMPVTDGDMSTRAHIAITLITLAGLAFVVRMVRRSQLQSKYTVLWLAASTVIVVLVAFPTLLARLSRLLGIYYPPATFLAIAVGVLFLVVVQFSWELSRSEERSRVLAEEIALLRARVEAVEDGDGEERPSDEDPTSA